MNRNYTYTLGPNKDQQKLHIYHYTHMVRTQRLYLLMMHNYALHLRIGSYSGCIHARSPIPPTLSVDGLL